MNVWLWSIGGTALMIGLSWLIAKYMPDPPDDDDDDDDDIGHPMFDMDPAILFMLASM